MNFEQEVKTKAITKAAEYFELIAIGKTPQHPDPFLADMLALACAGVVGIEVPEPLPDGVPTGPRAPGEQIRQVPEARTLMLAHGFKQVRGLTALIYSAFVGSPGSQWSAEQIVERLPVPATRQNVSGQLAHFVKRGLLERKSFGIYGLKGN